MALFIAGLVGGVTMGLAFCGLMAWLFPYRESDLDAADPSDFDRYDAARKTETHRNIERCARHGGL